MLLSSLPGMLVSFGLIILALYMGGKSSIFFNIPSILIVCGGTLGVVLTNYSLGSIAQTCSAISHAFRIGRRTSFEITTEFIEYANIVRRDGISALGPFVEDIDDPYLRKGLRLMMEGIDPAALHQVMESEIYNAERRHEAGVEFLNAVASYTPALGMLGTVIGLVQMLGDMNSPESIGPSMAVALITTFYGVLLANLVFLPLSGKLKTRSRVAVKNMEMQMAGVLGIANGENPDIIKEILEGFR